MTLPTPREQDVLHALAEYRHRHGYSATFANLAQSLGVSRTTAFYHVLQLEKKGHVRRDRRSRSIELIDAPRPKVNLRFPVLGTISKRGVELCP